MTTLIPFTQLNRLEGLDVSPFGVSEVISPSCIKVRPLQASWQGGSELTLVLGTKDRWYEEGGNYSSIFFPSQAITPRHGY